MTNKKKKDKEKSSDNESVGSASGSEQPNKAQSAFGTLVGLLRPSKMSPVKAKTLTNKGQSPTTVAKAENSMQNAAQETGAVIKSGSQTEHAVLQSGIKIKPDNAPTSKNQEIDGEELLGRPTMGTPSVKIHGNNDKASKTGFVTILDAMPHGNMSGQDGGEHVTSTRKSDHMVCIPGKGLRTMERRGNKEASKGFIFTPSTLPAEFKFGASGNSADLDTRPVGATETRSPINKIKQYELSKDTPRTNKKTKAVFKTQVTRGEQTRIPD